MINSIYQIWFSLGKGIFAGTICVAAITIDEHSSTTLGSAVAVGGLLIYLARWMQKVSDRLDSLEKQFKNQPPGKKKDKDDD